MEEYIYCGGKKLRCGFTTGTCAAAAAKAATLKVCGVNVSEVKIIMPNSNIVTFTVEHLNRGCAVRKNAGDDPDVTNGLLICAEVTLLAESGIIIKGGKGVGIVTIAGLEQKIGEAAINSIPRNMISKAVREVIGENMGAEVTIFVPEGETIAKKTANGRLGIVGGISILGTTGIVEPMSEKALTESIRLEIFARYANHNKSLLVTPGNYGETFAKEQYGLIGGVLCSNFLGEAVDDAIAAGFNEFLLIGHAGKLVKLAGGIFSTHSHTADARMEILAAHTALISGDTQIIKKIMQSVTTDAVFDILEEKNILEPVLCSLMKKMDEHLTRRGGNMITGAIMFTNIRGELGRTGNATQLLENLLVRED